MASKPKRRWGKKKPTESGESTPVNAAGSTSGYPTKEPLRDRTNQAAAFALKLVRSELQMCDAQLANDFTSIVSGGSIYIPEFICAEKDDSYFRALLADLTAYAERMQEANASQSESAASDADESKNENEIGNGDTVTESGPNKDRNPAVVVKGGPSAGLVKWSKHLKHEDPDFSETFMDICKQISDYFDMDIFAKRLNYYRDGKDWKPFHHDSHAYAKGKGKEDFTVGASFGSERQLEFLHEPSGAVMAFPQRNGDIFAFDTDVNAKFKHGVPKAVRGGPRISIICWGRRRTLNLRNSSVKK